MLIRLNKHIADLGIASRREADKLIEAGEVQVNGKTVTRLGTKVDPEKDKVTVAEKVMERRENLVYIALNKPAGYTSSVKRTQADPDIVLDLVDIPERIYPVGRLDKDTTGLLILTNDGTLTYELTHPSARSEKEYEVTFYKPIPKGAILKLEKGVKLWGEKTLPTRVKTLGPGRISIILKEGKNRQVRRICQKVGFPVKSLRRVRIKSLKLGDLPLGKWRRLSAQEVQKLRS